jgi:2-oxoglutarate-dependent dioxygenase
VVPQLFSFETAQRMKEEIAEVLAELKNTNGKLVQTIQYYANGVMDQYINSEHFRYLASQLLGGESSLYMPFTAVKKANGGGQFHFHQDNQYTRFDGPALNIWSAMVDMSPENGALMVAPRTHHLGTLASNLGPDGDNHRETEKLPEYFYPVRLRAGDAVIFSRLTLHGSGKNMTSEDRVAYALQYHRNDVKAFKDGEWKLLTERPIYPTKPVAKIVKMENDGE